MDIDCRRDDGSLCVECCKWMTFIVNFTTEMEKQLEFYKARGCKIFLFKEKGNPSGDVAITVPSVCPMLTVTGCRIQDKKPELCKKYDCRRDLFISGGKYYEKSIKEVHNGGKDQEAHT